MHDGRTEAAPQPPQPTEHPRDEMYRLTAALHEARRDRDDADNVIKALRRHNDELTEERNAYHTEADALRRDKATLVAAVVAMRDVLRARTFAERSGLARWAETLDLALRAVNADDDAGRRAIETLNATQEGAPF